MRSYFSSGNTNSRIGMKKMKSRLNSWCENNWSVFIILSMVCLVPFAGVVAQNQIEGRVVDQRTGDGLPFVHIVVEGVQAGFVTDLEGYFSFEPEEDAVSLRLSYVGYRSKTVTIDALKGESVVIKMRPAVVGLSEVVVEAGENPAHRLIRGVFENRRKHNPENNTSFRYLSYNKLHVTIDIDSLVRQERLEKNDTSFQNLVKFIDRQHLFMMESVVERVFRRPAANREEVLASRTSGFENPIFVLLGTELQSFSFYDSEFVLFGTAYKSPISRNFSRYYEFHIRDTIMGSTPEDTTYVVAYYPVEGRNFPALEGLLYIHVPDFAIQNVIAGPAREEEGANVTIRQQYEKIDGEYWFPVQLDTELNLHMVDMGDVNPQLKVRTYLDSIEINLPRDQVRIGPVDVVLNRDASRRDSLFWTQHRRNPLDSKELRAYHFMDSLGEEHDFERRAEWMMALFSGRISIGKVDLELNRIVNFNVYEGFRLGAGLRTNHRFSEVFEMGGWFGHGFRDGRSKYGGDANVLLNEDYQIRLGVGYQRELFETAGIEHSLRRTGGLLTNVVRPIFITQFDLTNEYLAFVDFHPRANFQTRMSVKRQNRKVMGDYRYLSEANSEGSREYVFSTLNFEAAFAPGDRYFQGMRGRQSLNFTYPRFYLSYAHGIDGFAGGEFDFQRLVFSGLFERRFPAFGRLTAELTAGAVFGDIPYSGLFTGKYSALDNTGFWRRISVADRNSFETMRPVEFTNDRFVMLMLRYDLGSLLFSLDSRSAPHLEFVARGMYGTLDVDLEKHQNIELLSTDQGYFETGFEVNRLLGTTGLGFYYRVGNYAFSSFSRNLSIRLTSKFVF